MRRAETEASMAMEQAGVGEGEAGALEQSSGSMIRCFWSDEHVRTAIQQPGPCVKAS